MIINAEEEKAHAYEAYTKAVSEYQNYINTHKKSVDTKTADTDGNSGDAQTSELADSVYDASVAAELENAIEAQKVLMKQWCGSRKNRSGRHLMQCSRQKKI
ncbi:MAG: hypothetical protein ACLUD0_07890 [Eubacterium ramulus]